jgi:hypothetical protein
MLNFRVNRQAYPMESQATNAPKNISDSVINTESNVSRFDRWVEFGSAIVLSLATVLTAWCGYQAARWGGEQASLYNAAGAARTQSAQQNNQAMMRMSTQVGLFTQYAAAISENNKQLADFLYNRFPPELRKATDDWLKTEPLKNPGAPRSPFDMPAYQLAEQVKAQQLEEVANQKAQAADDANELADRYVLLTVIFATSLFFCGISGKFQWQVIDAIMLSMGTLVLLGGLIVLFTLPIR